MSQDLNLETLSDRVSVELDSRDSNAVTFSVGYDVLKDVLAGSRPPRRPARTKPSKLSAEELEDAADEAAIRDALAEAGRRDYDEFRRELGL